MESDDQAARMVSEQQQDAGEVWQSIRIRSWMGIVAEYSSLTGTIFWKCVVSGHGYKVEITAPSETEVEDVAFEVTQRILRCPHFQRSLAACAAEFVRERQQDAIDAHYPDHDDGTGRLPTNPPEITEP